MGSSSLIGSSLKFCAIEDTLCVGHTQKSAQQFLVKGSFMEVQKSVVNIFAMRINGLDAKTRTRFSALSCISES